MQYHELVFNKNLIRITYMSRLITIKELSEKINVPLKTLYKWVGEEKIPVVRLPNGLRFDEKKIENWIESRSIKSKPLGTI